MSIDKSPPSPHSRADATRAKIIKSARKLFVENGFAGTSIGKIAAKAKINHSLIFHHFGNKEGLWKAVKQSFVKESNNLSSVIPSLSLAFPEFLRELLLQSMSFYKKNPDIVRMINWQRLEYKNEKDIGLTRSAISQVWINAFKHYQGRNAINTKLNPEFILTFVLSIASSAAMDPNIFINKEKELQAYIDFSVERLLLALK